MSGNRQEPDDAARPGGAESRVPQVPAQTETNHGERPRPEYGEYATPQDQANAIARALPPVSPLLTPADRPTAVTPAPVRPAAATSAGSTSAGSTPAASTHAASTAAASTPAASAARTAGPDIEPSRPRRRWDLVLSIGLLAYGLLTVFGAFVQYSDIPAIINQAYAAQRIGEFTSIEQADTVGTTIIVANVAIYAMTAFFTVRLLRARRLAFYVPLVGGAVAATISVILILTLVINDPAFREFVASIT